jgi:hypothetical protein
LGVNSTTEIRHLYHWQKLNKEFRRDSLIGTTLRQPQSRFRYASYLSTILSTSTQPTSPWTRKEFYRIAEECREFSTQLALHDQHRVQLKQCHAFNDWLLELKRYEWLGSQLKNLSPARPIARWQIMIIGIIVGLFAILALPSTIGQSWSTILIYSWLFALVVLYFIPQRFYGTTIELLEGKVLRVVELLETMLLTDDIEFTEAAYFQVKEHLSAAKHELRQQIDLAHR